MLPYHFETVIAIVVAYLIGSLSSAIIVCKLMRLPDPRSEGSNNPGATNVLRIGGKKAAAITLAGDMLKGVIPVLAAKWCGIHPLGVGLVMLAAFAGHLYPIFFRFQGGKGVATLLGCLLALNGELGLAVIATWLVISLVFRYSSLASLVAAALAPFYAWYFTSFIYAVIIVLMSSLLFYRHKTNIEKLLAGRENKIS